MTSEEARARLGLGASVVDPDEVRSAYLQRVVATTLDADLDGFVGLRRALEIASPGRASGASIQAARQALAAAPGSREARWRLLSMLSYAFDGEASATVLEGARLDPDGFLDELLLHFPAIAPPDLVALVAAGSRVSFGRQILLAVVHAEQGRPAAAVEALAAALNAVDGYPRRLVLRLALGVVFALQATVRDDAASAALGMIDQSANSGPVAFESPPEPRLAMAHELASLKDSIPLELRQAAARAAQQDDLANLPYAARFAARNVDPSALRQLRRRLQSDAPVLARVLALDVPEDHLRPKGTPTFRYAIGAGAFVPLLMLIFYAYKRFTTPAVDVDKIMREVNQQLIHQTFDKACADPNSEMCRSLLAQTADGGQEDDGGAAASDAGLVGDGGLDVRRTAGTRRRHRPHQTP
jgi:hypothetical protein